VKDPPGRGVATWSRANLRRHLVTKSSAEYPRPVSKGSRSDKINQLERSLREALTGEATVRWAYLFGSAARGETFNDLDVAIMLADGALGAVALGRVAARIETAGRGLPVDVVDLESAAPALAGRIAREGRLLADRDPEARRRWELEANSRALDIEPWLVEFARLRNEALRRRATHGRS
jgi:predicted nucleotidyltransferase